MLATIVIALAGIAVAAGILAVIGPDRIWLALPQPRDLAPVQFETLVRRDSPNDALVAPSGQVSARIDIPAPSWSIPPDALARAVAQALAMQPRVTRLDDGAEPLRLRYRQLTALMRYPDVIDIQILPAGEGGSTLALYSRSMLGYSDLGANAERARLWLDAIDVAARQM